jgi:hypothetical protein
MGKHKWNGNLEERRHIRVDNIETDLQDTGWQTCIRLIWPRTGTCGRLLQTLWTFGFDKMLRVCWLAMELSASQEGLYCMELSSQSVCWLPIITYLVPLPRIYWTSLVLVHAQTKNTYHAFLHNAKHFFKSLHYNCGTPTASSCRIFSKCNKVAERNLTRLTILVSVSERKYTDHMQVIKHATLYTVTHAHFYQELTVDSATIKCEQQYKHKPVCNRCMAKFI